MRDERRRRGLAVGSRDRDAARAGLQGREGAEAEIELGDDLHAGMPRGGQNGCVRRDTRRDHYTGGLANLVDVVAADFDVDPGYTLQRFGGCAGVRMVGRVARIDTHPFARQQPRGSDATLAEPDDRHHAPRAAPGIGYQPGGWGDLLDHRTLSVASAIIAHSTPRM